MQNEAATFAAGHRRAAGYMEKPSEMADGYLAPSQKGPSEMVPADPTPSPKAHWKKLNLQACLQTGKNFKKCPQGFGETLIIEPDVIKNRN